MELLDLARHVRTQAGVRRYHKPIGALISGRETAKVLVRTARLDAAFKAAGTRGTGVSKGTLEDPINCAGNVVLAAKLLSEGKHIRLNHEAEVGTLLDRLAFLTNEAVKQGKDAPNIDLCRVSVPKTNLFCAKTKGIPRAKMPQLSGEAVKGSKADALPRARGNEVDIIPEFRKELARRGIKVTDTSMPADHLKATQDQLIGPKVAGIYEAMKAAPSNSGLFERIMVTRDGYVIDGHHRWAAQVALETTNGTDPAKMKMKVSVLDMDIGAALDLSLAFAAAWGIPQQGFDLKPGFDATKSFSFDLVDLVDIDLVRHVRTPEGAKRFGEKIGEVITRDVHTPSAHFLEVPPVKGKKVKKAKSKVVPNRSTILLNGIPYSMDDALKMVSEAYDWPVRDKRGGKGSDPESIRMQDKAQILAKTWSATPTDDENDARAKGLWQDYQSPQEYGAINAALRNNTPIKGAASWGDTGPEIAALVDRMFDEGGYTTELPMTVYRALKSSRASSFEPGDDSGTEDWAKKLTPGTVFTDKGIVSTTAHLHLSEGWLLNDAVGTPNRTPQEDDVVVEIRIPVGTRVVGGDPQFIETMLHPGSRIRVISSKVQKAIGVDPITADKKTFTATHVVAELIPDGA